MFTGIVQTLAKILSIKNLDNAKQITVSVDNLYAKKLELGASIAINGVCLTVVKFKQHDENNSEILFDVIDETLRVTNLGVLDERSLVNFERSLKMGDELGGHIVSGHIHGQAELFHRVETSSNCQLIFKIVPSFEVNENRHKIDWLDYIFDKGFVTVNGTSLTVGMIENDTFSVHLIPETLLRTNLGALAIGQRVNIECDQQTITIVNTIKRLDLKKLIK